MSSADNISVLEELAVIAGGVVVSGALFYAAVNVWSKLRPVRYALSGISRGKVGPLSDLRSLMPSKSSESGSKSSTGKFVVIRGITKANTRNDLTCDALASQVSGEKCVVLEQTWASFPFCKRRTSLTSSLFFIGGIDKEDHSNDLLVNLEGSNQSLPLKVVFDLYTKKIRGNRCPVHFNSSSEFLVQEKILPIGNEITAIGICSLQDGNPSIKAIKKLPFFLTEMRVDELVQRLVDLREFLFIGSIFLGLLSTLVLLETITRSLRLSKKWDKKGENCKDTPDEQ